MIPDEHRCVLDRAAVLARVDGDVQLLRELVAIFESHSPKLLSSMREAIARNDSEALGQAAHKLKGSIANFCATEAYAVARRLEKMGASGDLGCAAEALRAIEEEIARLRADLAQIAREERV